jgi:hypothetical protein
MPAADDPTDLVAELQSAVAELHATALINKPDVAIDRRRLAYHRRHWGFS